jgi:phosphatidylserine/phosphatidylglycerophosphate/cardiolipin synthase-like enzyme
MMELLFLRPGSESAAKALGILRSLLADTAGEVRIAIAYLTHQLLVEEIIRRQEQRRVTLLLLNSADFLRPSGPNETEVVVAQSLLKLLEAAWHGPPVLEAKTLGQATGKYQNMHHKFAVTDNIVAFGSVNWTKSALAHNYELFAVSDDPSVISQVRLEFDALWKDAQDMHTGQWGLRSIMCPMCREADCVDFESYGPRCIRCGHIFRVVTT